MKRVVWSVVLASGVLAPVSMVAPGGAQAASAAAAKRAPKTVTVCRRGCRYPTIQKGVDAVRKGGTVRVKPGTYREGVTVAGAKKDGISIRGTKGASRTVLQGKGAKDKLGNGATNGVFVDGADRVKLTGLKAVNYSGNGFFVRNAKGYTWNKLVAGFNRSYGLYAFNSRGGTMKNSTGYGHGDSAFYVGQTPPQSKPRRTKLTHLRGYENVLGYSGTNSRYVDITNSDFYNNGAGVVPNTLKSEKYAPSEDGTIRGNRIFWNNFNYFAPSSKVKPLPSATGDLQYPTGVGVVLFGVTGWTVSDNDVFGNFKWGLLSVSDPGYKPATNVDNLVSSNRWGLDGKDTNAVDLMSEGSGTGNCYGEPTATRDPGETPDTSLYPPCTDPKSPSAIDGTQLLELLGYLSQKAPQEDSWVKHPHAKVDGFTPIDGQPVR